VRLALLTS